MKVVAFNDDRGDGTRNSYIKWTNNTGSSKTVRVVPFAFSSSTTGQTQFTVVDPSGIIRALGKKPIMATPVVHHTNPGPFPDCTGPSSTRIQLKRDFGGGFRSALIAVNFSTAKGGVIHEGAADSETLNLAGVLPGTYWNFLLGVMFDIGHPVYEDTRFTAIQSDRYSCNIMIPPAGL